MAHRWRIGVWCSDRRFRIANPIYGTGIISAVALTVRRMTRNVIETRDTDLLTIRIRLQMVVACRLTNVAADKHFSDAASPQW